MEENCESERQENKKNRGVRPDGQNDRKIECEGGGGGGGSFPEAIITWFNAVGHQNLIKIYTTFGERERGRLSPRGFLSNIKRGKKKNTRKQYSGFFNGSNTHYLGNTFFSSSFSPSMLYN